MKEKLTEKQLKDNMTKQAIPLEEFSNKLIELIQKYSGKIDGMFMIGALNTAGMAVYERATKRFSPGKMIDEMICEAFAVTKKRKGGVKK